MFFLTEKKEPWSWIGLRRKTNQMSRMAAGVSSGWPLRQTTHTGTFGGVEWRLNNRLSRISFQMQPLRKPLFRSRRCFEFAGGPTNLHGEITHSFEALNSALNSSKNQKTTSVPYAVQLSINQILLQWVATNVKMTLKFCSVQHDLQSTEWFQVFHAADWKFWP